MISKSCGLFALCLAGCTGFAQAPPEHDGTISTGGGGDDGDLSPISIDGDDSCCGAPDLALFTEGDAPCPEGTTEGFAAHAELIVSDPHTCTECSCSPAACTLPEGMLVFPAKCADADGTTPLPFGPAAGSGWDGSCNQENALPANQLCDGALCAQSLLIPATTVAPCAPSVAMPSKPDWTWGRRVRQCRLPQRGCEAGQVCVPREVPAGFELCRYANGDEGCPAGYYSEPSVFYMGVDDDRDCEVCECGQPQGAQCEAYVSVYKGDACASPIAQHLVASAPLCVDVVAGSALSSADASMVTDVPGSCAPSGGEPTGDLEPTKPVTLCCPNVPR